MKGTNTTTIDPEERTYLEKVKSRIRTEQANRVFEHVQDLSDSIFLIDPTSSVFNDGVTISTAHLAKGLEFDGVILPFCNDRNYNSFIDRHMLYVSCTRGMHKVTLTYTGELPVFLRECVIFSSKRIPRKKPEGSPANSKLAAAGINTASPAAGPGARFLMKARPNPKDRSDAIKSGGNRK